MTDADSLITGAAPNVWVSYRGSETLPNSSISGGTPQVRSASNVSRPLITEEHKVNSAQSFLLAPLK